MKELKVKELKKRKEIAELARPSIFEIKPYVPGKPIEEVQRELGLTDVVKLASNENPLGPAPAAIQALKDHAAGVSFYPDGSCFALKKALAAHLGIDPDYLIVGNGSDEVIKLLAEAFLSPQDEVIISPPTFGEYAYAAHLMGARVVTVPAIGFTHDLEAMAGAVTAKTKIIFVCNPNNPTGTYVNRDAVERFMNRIPEDVLVVFDEAYYEYVEAGDFPRTLEYVKQGRNVLVLRTFSKIYGLAGLRVGYGIGRSELVQLVARVREPFNVNLLAQQAAIAALGDAKHISRSREVNHSGKSFLNQRLSAMGFAPLPSQTNFLFVDLRTDAQQLFKAMLKLGVIVRSGDIFGEPTFIRVTIGAQAQNERFIHALAACLGKESR
ncbi:MAG: histidinol-phosphate transaminase [Syntrophothermus sp.]